MIDGKKYLFAFLIASIIFGTAIFASNKLSDKKLDNVEDIENRIALEILASETQFSLLEETQCRDVGKTFLARELGKLAERLQYAESESSFDPAEVENLKRYYSLLQIKDYLLLKRITEKCGTRPTFLLYFYSNKGDCKECERTGYVLTALHEKYPDLRIYSFDYNLDLDAIRTLEAIYNIENNLPALIINGDPYYGFRTVEELETEVPALKRLKLEYDKAEAAKKKATSTATTTSR